MPILCKSLIAISLVLGAARFTAAQETVPPPVLEEAAGSDAASGGETLPPPLALPSPLEGMGPQSTPAYASSAATQSSAATAGGPGITTAAVAPEDLPAPAEVIRALPLPDIAPSAIVPFSSAEGSARLVRGDEVVVLSNSALRNSGVFDLALQNSATLAQQYHELQVQTLRIQQLGFEMAQADAAAAAAESMAVGAANTPPDEQASQALPGLRARVDSLSNLQNETIVAQARAEAQFEMDLWNYGINGAKVGTLTTRDESAVVYAMEPERYVMVQAIGDDPQNNLGYSRTVVYHTGELGSTTVPSEYLLPLPVEANDLFYDKGAANYVQRAPDGWMMPLTADPTKNPVLQALATPKGSIYYDTGFVTAGPESNFAENVSLGSRHDPAAGQTFFTDAADAETFPLFPELDLAMNLQAMDVGGGNSLQFFTVANNDLDNNVFAVSSLGARLYNRSLGSFFEGWSLVAGLKQSVFGELAMTPSGVNGNRTLLGTVNRRGNVPQFSIDAPFSNYLTGKIGIEDPDHQQNDVFYPGPAAGTFTRLNRYPTLATSLDLHDREKINRLQLGGLLRSNGYELNATNQEFFATGWGLSAIAQFERGNSTNFFGVVGGEGVGEYMEGIQFSVVSNPAISSIESIAAYGAYAGRSMWFYDECNRPLAVINAAYGYSLQENPDIVGLDPNRKLHQAWINYTRFFGERLGVGVEYQYGYREVVSGDVGEDHRAMMVVTLRSSSVREESRVQNYAFAPGVATVPQVTGAGGDDPELLPPLPASTTVQMEASGATVNGRPIEEVVSQYQMGGPAFQQGL